MPRIVYQMTAAKYKAERQKRGTQKEVAKLLGVALSTLSDRERGDREINPEAVLAIQALPIGAVLDKAFAPKSKPRK